MRRGGQNSSILMGNSEVLYNKVGDKLVDMLKCSVRKI